MHENDIKNDAQPEELANHEEIYNKIIGFYDLAEKLVDSVEYEKVRDPITQLEFIEPVVRQIEEATDILAEEYRKFVATGKKPGVLVRKRIEKSIRNIHSAILECQKHA